MKIFAIEAYGGKDKTDGSIAHFKVYADSAAHALDIVRHSHLGLRYANFDILDESEEFQSDESGIIAEGEGPYHAEEH